MNDYMNRMLLKAQKRSRELRHLAVVVSRTLHTAHLQKKNTLRVLFIASDNNNASGAFLSMTALNVLLREKKNVETFVILPEDGSGEELLREKNIPFYKIESINWVKKMGGRPSAASLAYSKLINHFAIRSIAKFAKENEFDLIHINTTYSYVGACAAKQAGIPFVWHLREFLEEDQGKTLWDREKGNALINQADRIVAISKSIYKKYEGVFTPGKLVCINNGIDTKAFLKPEKEIMNREKCVFLMVGDFRAHKGQQEFSEACIQLFRKGYRDFEVWFIGEGDQTLKQKIRERFEQNGMGDLVTFLGYRKNVPDYLEKSDVTFMCSRAEAFGRVTVEAMLAGNLLVGANTAGTVDLVEDMSTGLLYEAGNVDDLCSKMMWLMQHRDEAKTIAARGRAYMAENMTAEINADHIYNLYREILRERDSAE